MTLADLIPLIQAADLTALQKRDQISAVRTIARLLNAEPGDIEADPVRLRSRLATLSPEALGLSRGRWANLRSLLGKALHLARPMMPARQRGAVSPEWARLLAQAPQRVELRLTPLAR